MPSRLAHTAGHGPCEFRRLLKKELHDFSHHGLVSIEYLIEIGQIIMTMHAGMYGTSGQKVSSDVLNVDSQHEFASTRFGHRRRRLHQEVTLPWPCTKPGSCLCCSTT